VGLVDTAELMELKCRLRRVLRLPALRDKGLVCQRMLLVSTARRQHRRGELLRERLGPAPRLLGFAGLLALVGWGFGDRGQELASEKEQPPLIIEAQPAPREPVRVWQVSSQEQTPEAPSSTPATEPPPSTAVMLRPPFDVVDVRTIRAGERTITLAGIERIGRNATCRARDGTRWSCEKLATDAPRKLVISQSLSCNAAVVGSTAGVMAVCTTGTGHDLARALVAEGWARARDDAPSLYRSEQKTAEERGLGLWGWRVEERRASR